MRHVLQRSTLPLLCFFRQHGAGSGSPPQCGGDYVCIVEAQGANRRTGFGETVGSDVKVVNSPRSGTML